MASADFGDPALMLAGAAVPSHSVRRHLVALGPWRPRRPTRAWGMPNCPCCSTSKVHELLNRLLKSVIRLELARFVPKTLHCSMVDSVYKPAVDALQSFRFSPQSVDDFFSIIIFRQNVSVVKRKKTKVKVYQRQTRLSCVSAFRESHFSCQCLTTCRLQFSMALFLGLGRQHGQTLTRKIGSHLNNRLKVYCRRYLVDYHRVDRFRKVHTYKSYTYKDSPIIHQVSRPTQHNVSVEHP